MRLLAVALALAVLTAPAGAEVTYRQYNGDTYGSDGTRIHRFGGDTYIRRPDGREVKCHDFSGKT